MAESEVLDVPSGAPGAESSTADVGAGGGGDAEQAAAESFLADWGEATNGAGSISKDPIAAAQEPVAGAEKTAAAAGEQETSDAPAQGNAPAADPATEVVPEGKPFAYGEGKTVEWATEIPGEGIFIAPDAADRFKAQLSDYERVTVEAADLSDRVAHYESIGGVAKLGELSEQVAMLDAAGSELIGLLKDPTGQGILSLLVRDAEGNIIPDPARVNAFIKGLESAAKIARYEAKEKWGQTVSEAQRERQQQSSQAQLGTHLTQSFERTLSAVAQHYPQLTKDDLDDARAAFGPVLQSFARPATKAEAQALGITAGQTVLDPAKMQTWFDRRAAARKAAPAQGTTAPAKVAAENAARLRNSTAAGKTQGTAPASSGNRRPGAGKAAPPDAKGKIAPDDDGTFNYIMRNAMAGRHSVQDV